MPDLLRFTADTLPDPYSCQIRDFVRILWFDLYADDLDAPLHRAEWQPLYFVMAERHVLMSAAVVISQAVKVGRRAHKVYGLSSVMTYPAFRTRGYGRLLVNTATDHIKQQSDGDFALLWTESSLERFYQRSGWQPLADTEIMIGDPDQPRPRGGFPMILPLAVEDPQTLLGGSFYFGRDAW